MKRSTKYDVFRKRPDNDGFNKKTWKEKLKIGWKYSRILVYMSLAALSLTGCIQTFVLKSSSTVGSGIELYNDKNNIAPYVNNYQITTKKIKRNVFDANGEMVLENGKPKEEEVEVDVLSALPKENFSASNETIKKIKEDLRYLYGDELAKTYGSYNNVSSSLRVIGKNNKDLNNSNSLNGPQAKIEQSELLRGTGPDSKYLFMNNKLLEELDKQGKSYKVQNKWEEINFFAVKRPDKDNDKNLSIAQKQVFGQGITNINGAFQAFEKINSLNEWRPVEIQNGQYVTYDADGDGINDSNELVVIKNQERINKFRYAFDAEIVSISKSETGLFNSEKYARDYLQSISNISLQFQQLNPFFEKVMNLSGADLLNLDERYKAITKNSLSNLIEPHQNTKNINDNNLHVPQDKRVNPAKLLTLEQKNAIIAYQNEIITFTKGVGFGIKKQIYDDEKSDDYVNWDNRTPYETEFLPGVKDKRYRLLGAAPLEQKPISSWGEAWGLGPFYGLVVWPIAYLINAMVGSMPPLNGWAAILSIIIVVLATRIFTTLITYKSLFAQHKQQALAPRKAKIDAKYEGFKGNKQMEARKRQEIADLYKKNNVSMSGPLLSTLVTMPIFLAVWRVIQGIPNIKSATWLGIQFSQTSWRELFNGAWQYLPLLLIAVIVQAASQLLPRYLNKKRMSERANVAEKAALKKANKTQNIIMVVFIFMAVAFEAGVQIYWIVGGLWQIFQTLMVHWIVKTNIYKEKLYKYF